MKKRKLTLALCCLCLGTTGYAQTTNPAPYCDGAFDDANGFLVSDAIKNVSFGTLSNNSGGQYAAPHYVYYSNLAAPVLTAGTTVPMSITFEVHGGSGYGVWIDFNRNNTFETNEKVAGSTANGWLTLGNNVTVTPSIVIPATAQAGETRMRIRIVEDDNYTATNGAAILPCNTGTSSTAIMDWGETEDYKVNITGGSTSARPVAAFTSNAITGTVNNSILTFTDNSTNSPTSRTWTFSPNTVAYQNGTTNASAIPALKFTAAGTYTVKLMVSNAAGKDSVTKTNYITIMPSTGIAENRSVSEMIVYPNPARDLLYVNPFFRHASLVIVDVYGKVCIRENKLSDDKLDISQLKTGLYFVRILKDGESFSKQILINK